MVPASAALPGSLLAGVFRDRLGVAGPPSGAAHTAGVSLVAAHLVAARTGSARLAATADAPAARRPARPGRIPRPWPPPRPMPDNDRHDARTFPALPRRPPPAGPA
ncbi:hypothetical protein GCM10010345_44390 [Streptomyces canarius]|uniref:Major facilitator superfamily (MFS) profile domain-containing protein n=1 Tax=Streptomyces canarius TaxID=285453 RepID=A0ABQ3CP82_9ACTN|nr:hypothetical protein GCM10010345_44390 [Streptomyces canarius]